MRNKTMTNGLKMIRRALALCLCLVLAAAAAGAEDMTVLSSGAEDWLNYECTLPDGRILLTGGKMENGRDGNFVPWIICMNQDRTVSWELIDRQEDGSTGAGRAAVLEDGTIAVNVGEHTEREMVKFFTKDGEKARPDLELPADAIVEAMEATYLMLTGTGDGIEQTVLMDYEGKELLRYAGVSLLNGYGYKVKGEETPVLYGQSGAMDGRARILKLNGMQDKTLWETELDFQRSDTDTAALCQAVKTTDGGYAAWLRESAFGQGEELYKDTDILVKFDAEGKVQWMDAESFGKDHQNIRQIAAFNGKIVVSCVPDGPDALDMNIPQVFRWYGDEGTRRGTTEVKLEPQAFAAVKEFLEAKDAGTKRTPSAYEVQMIPMEDGLWAMESCCVWENEEDENADSIFESHEIALVKVPEL